MKKKLKEIIQFIKEEYIFLIILLIITLLGFGVTLVEPDVQVFSNQAASIIEQIDGSTFCVFIALGVGIFTAFSFRLMILFIIMFWIVE